MDGFVAPTQRPFSLEEAPLTACWQDKLLTCS